MSATLLYADDLESGIPQVLVGAAVVAVVPATDLRGWAAETAWKIARAAAASGRRTALVDCFVDAPSLSGVNGVADEEGIVDAFEYGASLNRIVQAQPQANLFFIPTGTFASDAAPMMKNPRWRRLSAGFRHEEALLLLYVSADHLAGLAADPDGIIVLAPQGLDVTVAAAPALTEAVGHGMPLLAVVASEEKRVAEGRREARGESGLEVVRHEVEVVASSPSSRPQLPQPPQPPQHPQPPPRRRSRSRIAPMSGLLHPEDKANWPLRIVGIVLAVAAVGAMVWYAVTQNRAAAASAAVSRESSVVAVATPPLPPVESLPFAVQVMALPDLVEALAAGDTLAAHGTPVIVSPVRLRGRGVMYLVHAGPYATSARADSVLTALRAAGTIAPTAGTRDSLPLSVALTAGMTRAAALAERTRLQAAGVPAFILGAADSTFRLFAGAYSASAQATLLQDLLTPTGSAGALVPRAGYVP